jgi:hypothetical protein
MLDVTDTFDAFHRVVAVLWREFGAALALDEGDDCAGFDELVDQLEIDLFLPVCAHRLRELTGEDLDPDEVPTRIRLVSESGESLPGAAGYYHSHAFHPEALAADVPNAVLTVSLMSVPRAGIRLLLGPGAERRRSKLRRELPVH